MRDISILKDCIKSLYAFQIPITHRYLKTCHCKYIFDVYSKKNPQSINFEINHTKDTYIQRSKYVVIHSAYRN